MTENSVGSWLGVVGPSATDVNPRGPEGTATSGSSGKADSSSTISVGVCMRNGPEAGTDVTTGNAPVLAPWKGMAPTGGNCRRGSKKGVNFGKSRAAERGGKCYLATGTMNFGTLQHAGCLAGAGLGGFANVYGASHEP